MTERDEFEAEARRLMSMDPDDVYDRELDKWVSPNGRAELASLLIAVVRSDDGASRPRVQWPGDLVAYLPEVDLRRVLRACLPRTSGVDERTIDAPDSELEEDPPPDWSGLALFAPITVRSTTREQVERRLGIDPLRDPSFDEDPDIRPPIAPPFHLELPLDYRLRTARHAAVRFARRHHPTWALVENGPGVPIEVGGSRDRDVGAHLVGTLRLSDLGLVLSGSTFGAIDIDLPHGIGWEYYSCHVFLDEHGRSAAMKLDDGRQPLPSSGRRAVQPCTARLVPTPTAFERQGWGWSNRRENLNRLGGTPSFIQSPEYRTCPSCGQTSEFLAQFEMGIPTVHDFDLVDEGIAYAFLCHACRVISWLHQRT